MRTSGRVGFACVWGVPPVKDAWECLWVAGNKFCISVGHQYVCLDRYFNRCVFAYVGKKRMEEVLLFKCVSHTHMYMQGEWCGK